MLVKLQRLIFWNYFLFGGQKAFIITHYYLCLTCYKENSNYSGMFFLQCSFIVSHFIARESLNWQTIFYGYVMINFYQKY